MAIKKTIEIDVSTVQAVGGLDNLSKALEKVDSSAKGVEATFEEVYGDLKPLTARMGEAEDRLYELALAGQSASQEYKDLLASVGQYRQVQMKTDMVVDAAATTFDTKLGGALQGATSAFAGIQGAMALTGGQSEELEAAILKVQGAMALAEGVRGLREGSVAFKALGTSAKAALNGIKTGIAATGIGVLLVALGAVVAYWDDIKEAVNGVSSEQEDLNNQAAANLDIEQKKLDAISNEENILKLQGKSEREILQMKIAQTDRTIVEAEQRLESSIAYHKAQEAAAKRNQEILAGILKYMSVPLTLLLKTIDSVGEALGKDFGLEDKFFTAASKFVFDPVKTKAEGDAVVAEQEKALKKLQNEKAGYQLSINNLDKQSAKESADKQKEANDKAIQDEKDKADALERIRQGEIDTEAERRAEELRQIQQQYAELIAEADKYGQDTTALKEAQRTKEKELADKFALEDEEKRLAAEEKKKAEDQKKIDDDKILAEKQLEIEKAVAEGKKAIQEQSFAVAESGISVLKGVFEKNKAIQKGLIIAESAMGIAKIVTSTQAANAADRAYAATLGPAGAGYLGTKLVLNKVGAAIGIASNLAATSKALSALGGGSAKGGGGTDSGGSGGGAPAPTFNVVGNSGVNQIAQTLGSQQPVQAYVVASNVTTQQSLDRNIVNNASLG